MDQGVDVKWVKGKRSRGVTRVVKWARGSGEIGQGGVVKRSNDSGEMGKQKWWNEQRGADKRV